MIFQKNNKIEKKNKKINLQPQMISYIFDKVQRFLVIDIFKKAKKTTKQKEIQKVTFSNGHKQIFYVYKYFFAIFFFKTL